MVSTDRPIQVEVVGQSFSVVSDQGEEHVRRVAAYVDGLMRAQSVRAGSPFVAAVITALNIASEYQKLNREHERVLELIDRLTARLEAYGGVPARLKAERR